MAQLPVRAAGMAWYRREDYDRLRNSVFVDGNVLHDSYAEWFKAAKNGESQLRSQGHIVERVYIDPDEFPQWCAAHGLNVDAKGRTAFANFVVAQKHGQTH